MTTAEPQMDGHTGRILVVDDEPVNRQLLRDILELDGHTVTEAHDGESALRLAAETDPDVILLDVTMPGMNGFEVCRRLRTAALTTATPVLLVTALADREHRLQGMSSGANDYLVKPIDHGEVALRVRNAVRMRSLHRTLADQYAALQRLERLRDDLVSMLAHDFRSPLTGVRGFLELLGADLEGKLTPELSEYLAGAMRAVEQLNAMVDDMLDVSRLETAALALEFTPLLLRDAAMRAVTSLGPQPSFHQIPVRVEGDDGTVPADPGLIHRVLVNLLSNAVRFSPSGSPVIVTVRAEDDGATVRVRDHGPGIAESDRMAIFEKFRQGVSRSARGRGTGLGLTFCRLAIEAHQGRIGVESEPGKGSEFWIWLPAHRV